MHHLRFLESPHSGVDVDYWTDSTSVLCTGVRSNNVVVCKLVIWMTSFVIFRSCKFSAPVKYHGRGRRGPRLFRDSDSLAIALASVNFSGRTTKMERKFQQLRLSCLCRLMIWFLGMQAGFIENRSIAEPRSTCYMPLRTTLSCTCTAELIRRRRQWRPLNAV